MKSIDFSGNDLNIKSKRLQIVKDLEQIKQKTKSILYVVKGELFYNTDLGLDYSKVLDVVIKNIPNQEKRIAVVETLLQDENVKSIDNVEIINLEDRKQKINIQLTYKNGIATTIGGVEIG